MTRDQAIKRMNIHIAVNHNGNIKEFAKAIGIHSSTISKVRNKGVSIPPTVLAAIGLRKVVTYQKVSNAEKTN